MIGPIRRRLSRHGLPAAAGVAAAEQVLAAHQRHADVESRAGRTALAAARVEDDEHDPAAAALHPRRLVRRLRGEHLLDVREAADAAPGHGAVGAAPEARVARAHVEDPPVVRVDRQALAVAAAVLVAAHLERHVRALEAPPAVGGAEDRAVGRGRVGVGAAGEVQALRVGGVDRDALDAHQVAVPVPEPVDERLPAFRAGVPAVGAADVGAAVAHVLRRRMEDDAGDEAAADHLHVLPGVGLGRRAARGVNDDGQGACDCEGQRRDGGRPAVECHGAPPSRDYRTNGPDAHPACPRVGPAVRLR